MKSRALRRLGGTCPILRVIPLVLAVLALLAAPGAASAENWQPSHCPPSDDLTAADVLEQETWAREGDISASVRLECHYLSMGQSSEALQWLRHSAELGDPFTGQRYVDYLLTRGEPRQCDAAQTLATDFLRLEWLPEATRTRFLEQQQRAHACLHTAARTGAATGAARAAIRHTEAR